MAHLRSLFLVFATLCGIGLGAGAAQATPLTFDGAVVYLVRSLLPPEAEIEVSLLALSDDESTPTTIAQTRFQSETRASPIPYKLTFESENMHQGRHYALQARILDKDETVIFINEQLQPVFTGEPNDTQILVSPVTTSNLVGDWHIVMLGDKELKGNSLPTLKIRADGRANGHSGCNGFSTVMRMQDDIVSFSQIAATQIACSEKHMRQEQQIFEALGNVGHYKVEDDKVELQDIDGNVLMVLSKSKSK